MWFARFAWFAWFANKTDPFMFALQMFFNSDTIQKLDMASTITLQNPEFLRIIAVKYSD